MMRRTVILTEGQVKMLVEGKMVYQSFGLGSYDPTKFQPIRNRMGRNKPFGGLWASPDDGNAFTWSKWTKSEGFGMDKYRDDDRFDFTLSDDARILIISKLGDEDGIPMQWEQDFMAKFRAAKDDCERRKVARDYDNIEMDREAFEQSKHHMSWLPDFEKLSQRYDVIRFEENGFTHNAMYGWDCDCILVMNPSVVCPVGTED